MPNWGKRKDGQAYIKNKAKGMSGSKMSTMPTKDVHMKELQPSSMRRIHICKNCNKLLEGAEEINKHFKDNPSHLETENKVEKDKEDNEFSILSGNNIHLKEHESRKECTICGYAHKDRPASFCKALQNHTINNPKAKDEIIKDILAGNSVHFKEHISDDFGREYWSGLNDEEKLNVVKDALKYVSKEERHDMEHIETKIPDTEWDDLYDDEKEAVLKVIS